MFNWYKISFYSLSCPVRIPTYVTPESKSQEKILTERVSAGARRIYADYLHNRDKTKEVQEIRERLIYEHDVIKKSGYSGYFLILADTISRCREKDIAIGPGRGSAAGSLIAYCLGITGVDPLKYNFPVLRVF